MVSADTSLIRKQAGLIRKMTLTAIQKRKSGHPGGSFSIADLLAALYFGHANIPSVDDPDRDRTILSKGHAGYALYAALSLKGFWGVDMLDEMDPADVRLQGHPDVTKTPGIEMSSGSLGQGLSVGLGLSLGLRLHESPAKVFVILGDGELAEGQVWEAAMAAAHFKVDNLTAIVDNNKLQIMGACAEVMGNNCLRAKWEAFGWNVLEIDGHDYGEIIAGLETSRAHQGQPTVIIANTVKGKGVSYMENQVAWHHTAGLTSEQFQQAMAEIDANMEVC